MRCWFRDLSFNKIFVFCLFFFRSNFWKIKYTKNLSNKCLGSQECLLPLPLNPPEKPRVIPFTYDKCIINANWVYTELFVGFLSYCFSFPILHLNIHFSLSKYYKWNLFLFCWSCILLRLVKFDDISVNIFCNENFRGNWKEEI